MLKNMDCYQTYRAIHDSHNRCDVVGQEIRVERMNDRNTATHSGLIVETLMRVERERERGRERQRERVR